MAIVNKLSPVPVTLGLKNKTQNCIPCLLKPTMHFGSFVGLTCLHGECPHDSFSQGTSKFSFSRLKFFGTVLCIAAQIYGLLTSANQVMTRSLTSMQLLVILSQALFCAGDIYVRIVFLLNTEKRLLLLSCYQTITDSRHFFGIYNFFSDADIKRIKKNQVVLIYSILCFMMCYTVMVLCFSSHQEKEYIDLLSDLLGLYTQFGEVLQINTEIRLLEHLLKRGHSRLKASLNQKSKKSLALVLDTPLTLLAKHAKDMQENTYVLKDIVKCKELYHVTLSYVKLFTKCIG